MGNPGVAMNMFQKKRYSNQDGEQNKNSLFHGSENHHGHPNSYDQHENQASDQLLYREQHLTRLKNTRLHTSSLKRLMNTSDDGRGVLRSEIEESNNRVMQVRHGMLIKQLIQQRYTMNGNEAPVSRDGSAQSHIRVSNHNDNTFLTGIDSYKKPDPIGVMTSKTQPSSPAKIKPPKTLQETLQANSQSYQDPTGLGVIFIPNYKNKKPKIIRFADLAKLMPKGGFGDATVTNRQQPMTKKFSDYDSQPISFTDELKAQGLMPATNTGTNKKTNNSINYHRKLAEEFEKYENIFKEQLPNQGTGAESAQTPRNGSFINSLISNQFLSKSLIRDAAQALGTPRKIMSRDTSQSESQSPNHMGGGQSLHGGQSKYSNKGYKPSKIFTINQVQGFQSGNLQAQQQIQPNITINTGGPTTPINASKTGSKLGNQKKNAPGINQSVQNSVSSNKDSQQAFQFQMNRSSYPKGFEQKLTKHDRDQILVSAILASTAHSHNKENTAIADMEAELLAGVSEEGLWKECTILLKDYFKVDFLNELKDNKVLVFRMYKLYLLHSLSVSMKQHEENQQQIMQNNMQRMGGANGKRNRKNSQITGQDDQQYGNGQLDDSSDDEQNYRGHNGNEAFKQKMQGFIRLLQEILNPADQDALSLDSVFQLKTLVKSYYEKKGALAGELTETLYGMMSERPQILQAKKRYFFNSYEQESSNVKKIRNLFFELEQMRMNAEKERIGNYREVLEKLLAQASANSAQTKKY